MKIGFRLSSSKIKLANVRICNALNGEMNVETINSATVNEALRNFHNHVNKESNDSTSIDVCQNHSWHYLTSTTVLCDVYFSLFHDTKRFSVSKNIRLSK